ncbi:chorismate-binding protein [Cellulophaga omnivescoria]|uniref:chorismate-binding protein n=1 Tax=Cellulophaga omnivescoria TaxID=1888890 RepID=UPI000986C498|nr:chorismate-binding protein [Cellulophaga omnivescoria]WBU88863.1 chorismate-binding protein [Cellulophaga omnivescoria]
MNHFFDRLQEQLNAQKPFVVYRKPNEDVVSAVLQEDAVLHYVKNYQESGFVFAPFDSNSASILIPNKTIITTNYSTDKLLSSTIDNDVSISSTPIEKQDHIALVKKGITAIGNGYLEKVVLSRCITTHTATKPIALFKELLSVYKTAFCYLWYHPKVGMWLGATPEVLLKVTNKRIETSSLAGTQVYEEGKEPVWGEKEYNEQDVVTQFIKKELAEKVTNLKATEVTSVRAGKLWHLRTKITGLMQNNLQDILVALHPTPATCGLPKQEAKEFILKNENYNRSFYTGFLGELNFTKEQFRSKTKKNIENRAYTSLTKVSNLYVNLRCAELTNKTVKVYVGGGITNGSIPEKEWEETVAKSGTMLRIILK